MNSILSLPIKERLSLAGNIEASEEVLAILAQDDDLDVLLAVWNNPSTDYQDREELLYHPSDWLRQAIAEDQYLYEDAILILAQDGNAGVRERIAENPNTPSDVRELLAKDENQHVRLAAGGDYADFTGCLQDESDAPYSWLVDHLGEDETLTKEEIEALVDDSIAYVILGVGDLTPTEKASIAHERAAAIAALTEQLA